MAGPPNILLLVGSPRQPSYTRSLARRIERTLVAHGARVGRLDLHDTPLPPIDLDLRRKRTEHPDPAVAELFRMAEAADGYVLASPTYHNSYAGVLKNALDYLMLRDMRYRPVGLAAHSGRSTQAVDHLRQVVRGLLGVAIPTQVCTRDADFSDAPAPDGMYEVTDPDILSRIERFAAELVLFAGHMRALRADMEQPRAAK